MKTLILRVFFTFTVFWSSLAGARPFPYPCADWLALPLPVVAQATSFTCGVACLDSALGFLLGHSPGEPGLAYALGSNPMTGTTGPAIVHLAHRYGLFAQEQKFVTVMDLSRYLLAGEVVFLAWNSNGSPHYSLLRGIGASHITLMDPWHAISNPNQYSSWPLNEFLSHWYDGFHYFGHVIRISRHPLRL